MLSTEAEVIKTMLTNLASFVCAACAPNRICINTISELRWNLFCKHMVYKVTNYLRDYIQSRVCGQASIALQEPQLDPLQDVYNMVFDDQLIPAVVAKQTVHLSGVLVEPTIYPAPVFASDAVSVRMMRTHRTSMTLNVTMISTICK